MNKMKVMTILGTRPEIIRLSECIKACDQYFDHILVHTGQNYDYSLNEVFFEELELRKPDYFLDCVGADLGETIGNIIAKSYSVIKKEKPAAILILGDTNSALSAISAKRLKVPIFHMEAGNRCWDWNVPEMINRKIVDSISDVNLPYTEHSRRFLLNEGQDGKMIFVTGSPLQEVISVHRDKIESSDILNKLGIESKKYFLLSAHREENIDNEATFFSLMGAVNEIAEQYNMPVVYSTHPRSKKIIEQRKYVFHKNVKSLTPFGFFDYNKLQSESRCVLSDSGTLSEESAILGFSGVLIRTSTERPEVIDKGSIIVGGTTKKEILQATEMAISMQDNNEKIIIADDYSDNNVSLKIVKIIQSYEKIVNKCIWGK